MFNPKLNVAFWDYDRTRALVNGSVKIAGADASFHTAPIVTILFEGVVAGKFNVSELGMTYFLRTFKNGRVTFCRDPNFSESFLPAFRRLRQQSQRHRNA